MTANNSGSECTKSVLAVIPVHNRLEDICDLLNSFRQLALDGLRLTIAIIDDGSEPPLGDKVAREFDDLSIRFLRNKTALGPGHARNQAYSIVDSDYIWFIDSDAEIINGGVLKAMVGILEFDPSIAGTGGYIERTRYGRRVLQLDVQANYLTVARAIPPESFTSREVDIVSTCNVLMKRVIFESVAPFNPKLRRDEDVDICFTLKRKGLRFWQAPESLVFHKLSTKGRDSGHFISFSNTRHYLEDMLFTRAHLVARHKPLLLLVLPLLDLYVGMRLFYFVRKGVYLTERLQKVESASSGSWMGFIFLTVIRSYFRGFRLVLGGKL
jgi:GT2 family glycosyltransferase|tara:strand:+ start:1388 stop:2365 length:978 start_codon:yes stop_codon:yes gene_type:complete